MIKGPSAGSTTSALDTKPLKSLVEAGQLSTTVDQPLLSAGPGRMRFRVDVEPQGVPRLAVGRARLVRAAVRHHDGYLMIFGVNSFFHRTALRTALTYSERAPRAQCRADHGRPARVGGSRRAIPALRGQSGRKYRRGGRHSGRARYDFDPARRTNRPPRSAEAARACRDAGPAGAAKDR